MFLCWRGMPRRIPLPLVAGLLLLAACTRSVSLAYTTQTTPVGEAAPIAVTGAGFEVHTAVPVGPDAVNAAWAGVLGTLNRYLEVAVLTPLRSGGPAGDLAPLFTPLVVDRVTSVSSDRAAFVDEGLAPATDLRSVAAVATLTSLGGPDAAMGVVSVGLDLRLTGRVDGAPLTVSRTGELVLVPSDGAWRIAAYDLKVTRTLTGASTTTTARS